MCWLHAGALMSRAEDLQPLVDYVRNTTGARPLSLSDALDHFTKTPSAPFGTGATPFRYTVERAEELGLVVRYGTGFNKKGWLRPAQDQP
jgi:hypothetical protein